MPTGLPTEEFIKFGARLRQLRIKKGLSQAEMVDISGGLLRMGSVIAIENGKYNVGMSQVLAYVRLLGYKLEPIEYPPT
ncbi:MAG: helix-turn-helix domain-containing protein [Bacteroidales bacterium]|nr:helix-turn-helix domain-containing protein [Candidatus Colicola caccequi]